jgi:hypothetical protein
MNYSTQKLGKTLAIMMTKYCQVANRNNPKAARIINDDQLRMFYGICAHELVEHDPVFNFAEVNTDEVLKVLHDNLGYQWIIQKDINLN